MAPTAPLGSPFRDSKRESPTHCSSSQTAATASSPGHSVETPAASLHRSDARGLATGVALSSAPRQQSILEFTIRAQRT
ncbi:hypothetical protein Aduo_013732 [Ancylostoma duodenale]